MTCPQLRTSFGLVVATAVSRRHAPPHQSHFTPRFPTHPPLFRPCLPPHHPAGFSVSDRNAALSQSVHCLPPVGGVLPLHQLRIHDSRPSVTKVHLLYTPMAPRTGPVSKSLMRCIIFAIPFRQFSPVIRLFKLSGECRDPMNRSKSQRGERVGAEIETPVAQAA